MADCWQAKRFFWQKAGKTENEGLWSGSVLLIPLLSWNSVKLFTLSVNSQVNQFTDNTSRFIILALVVTAVLQVG